MNIRILIYIIFLLLIKCASNPISSKLDNWKSQKQNNDYWYGIAIIDKTNQVNIQEVARNQAITDIASQIRIQINQNFKRVIEEHNYQIKDHSVQTLDTQISNNLEEVEIIDFEDLGDSYMLFARLSKSKYYAAVERKRTNAKELALEYLLNISYPSFESFEYLAKAENEVSPYMDYPIYVMYNNNKENLYSLIQRMRNDLLNRISVNAGNNEIDIKSLIGSQEPIIFKVLDIDTNSELDKIPLFIKINDSINYCFTNTMGLCQFHIDKDAISKELIQYLYVGVDKNKLYINKTNDDDFKDKVIINLIPIDIFLNIDEYNLDTKNDHPYIEPIIKEFLIKELSINFTTDASNYDLLINVNATTRAASKKPNEYGIYQVFGDATIDIKFSNQEESILKLAINDIQGADFRSLEQAGHKALQKVSNKIFDETLVELVSILKQN